MHALHHNFATCAQAIDGVPHSTIAEVEIPACIPLVYRFDRGTNGELVPVPSAASPPISGEFLAPASELAEAQASIRNASLRRYGFAGFGGFPESLSPSESVYLPAEAPSVTAATPDGSALSMAPSWKVAPRPTAEQYVVIIRHGKTENNKLGIFTGWDDGRPPPSALTPSTPPSATALSLNSRHTAVTPSVHVCPPVRSGACG